MAPLALLYDIHANLPALEAALADARDAGASRFLLGGDYGVGGAYPEETVATLRALDGATWIRGNIERWMGAPEEVPGDEVIRGAVAAARQALGAELVEELLRLDQQVVLEGTRFCHASPLSDMRSFLPEPADDDKELLAGVAEHQVVFGHTHLAFRRVRDDGVELVNPGSVGIPLDGDPRAAFALRHEDGRIEHRRVRYDNEAAASAVKERFGNAAWTDTFVRRIVSARP